MTLPVGSVALSRKPYSTFCASVRLYLASLRHQYLGSFFLDLEDIRVLGVGPSGTLLKEQGTYNPAQNRGHKGPVLRPRCIGPREGPYPNYNSNSTLGELSLFR